MKVTTLQAQDKPEQLVCRAARGDYYDGYVGDATLHELMESVEYDERHIETIRNEFSLYELEPIRSQHHADYDITDIEMYAKMYALLERLFKRGHWGPFEHPKATFAVEGMSRSCMAQLTRHRHASFDVQSQRYVDFSTKDDPAVTPKSLLDPEHFSRETGLVDVESRGALREEYEQIVDELFDLYERMVDLGVPKEDARFVLPIGTKVNMSFSVNARMLLHIANLRERGDSQWEIRDMTTQVLDDEFQNWMPMTYHLWRDHGPTEISP
jgi:thymidylate synthase (FAD)